MKQISLGIVAHVDAGKTTLNECLLYKAKVIRKMGRVDHKDAFFDTDRQERDRGITIFAKTATIDWNDTTFTLVDTPGHVDFSCEMERTLQVLDIAVLVVSGLDGVQSHTETIFKLLEYYHIPTFIFVNKMDITTKEKNELIEDLTKNLSNKCVVFEGDYSENLATASESLLEEYLATGNISDKNIARSIQQRGIFPVYFGSALKDMGVEELLTGLQRFSLEKKYPEEFGMKIFKVSYDEQGTRLCYSKITGGVLNAKQKLDENEKVDQIRLVSGNKYTLLQQATAGQIVAIKGLNSYGAGSGLGIEADTNKPVLTAYMVYRVVLPRGTDSNNMLKELNKLQQEDPQIQVSYSEAAKEINVSLMGEIQLEIISKIIKNRTGVDISFDNGKVLFKETICDIVDGVGHFEPLRHYAEVHLRLEPLPAGSGLVFDSEVSTDDLSLNWQRLILTHLKEKRHKGVLIGAPITDIKIIITAGRSHLKHTEGGDFREATYRAVRQGLKKAISIVLEPFYRFTITLNKQYLSKVLYDLDNMKASYKIDEDERGFVVVEGKAPVRKMQNYQTTLLAATSGTGKIVMSLLGYEPCEDEADIIERFHYDSEMDYGNPTGSVFCAHGSGFYVPYNHVEEYMHIKPKEENISSSLTHSNKFTVSENELKQVFMMAGGRNINEKKKVAENKRIDDRNKKVEVKLKERKPRMLIVDGYNMMFGWEKTKGIDFDNARDIVINDISSYAGYKGVSVVIVFDAYKVKDTLGKVSTNSNFSIVYTKTGQTADAYIEKAVHDFKNKYDVYVASSDGTVQSVVFAQGARRVSARELEIELKFINDTMLK